MGMDVGGGMKSEPNVVPLCDILLVLLIIFMVVTPMLQKGVDVKLPEAGNTVEQPESPPVTLAVKKDGTVYVNADIITDRNALKERLIEELESQQDKTLYFKADMDLDYGTVLDVLAYAMEAGVEKVGVVTEQLTTEEGAAE